MQQARDENVISYNNSTMNKGWVSSSSLQPPVENGSH